MAGRPCGRAAVAGGPEIMEAPELIAPEIIAAPEDAALEIIAARDVGGSEPARFWTESVGFGASVDRAEGASVERVSPNEDRFAGALSFVLSAVVAR